MSLLLPGFVTEVAITEVTILVLSFVLLQIVLFSSTYLHYVRDHVIQLKGVTEVK